MTIKNLNKIFKQKIIKKLDKQKLRNCFWKTPRN